MEIQNLFAQRIGGKEFGINNEVYKFALIKKWKQEAEKKHSNNFKLIDMGVGEPDWAADDKVVDMLSIEAGKPENRFYSDNGILYRPMLGKGQLHGVPYSHSVQIRGQQIVQYPIYFFRMLLVF